MTNRPLLLLFNTEDDLKSAARLLKGRLLTRTQEYPPAARVVRIGGIGQLRSRLRSVPTRRGVLVALVSEFDLHQQSAAALAAMKVQVPNLLSAGQDQVFVLDRDQRMVAFFGRWPKDAQWRITDLLGKSKRELFGPDAAAVHEVAASRALEGEETTYEWSLPKGPQPVHLFTAASPLRNESHAIAGVLLVTRNVTTLKQEQFELQKVLEEKTRQLLDIESRVKQIAATIQRHPSESGHLAARHRLSNREREVLNCLSRGMRVRTVARTLSISVETVRRHVKAMFRKTSVHSQEALVQLFSEVEKPS